MSWEVWSVCGKCGHLLEKPSFGNVWFTRQHFPCCPECGASSWNYDAITAKVKRGRIVEKR